MDTRHGSPIAATSSATSNKAVVFSKMESLVREMQDLDTGIPIRSQKLFLTSIPSAFMGYDLIEWLMERLDIEDSAEAIHLANLLCQYGYFFPVGETRSLIVKDDSSLYRFQTPYYWPSQSQCADSTDYGIYLTKRLARNKQKHGLEDYELEAYNKLKKALQHKWDFITMQADEQVKIAKDRKKGDKIVTDSQERAYWRVYKPPPGYNNCLENAPFPDRANVANRVRKKTLDERKKEVEFFNKQIERTRMKASAAVEGLITHAETYSEYDNTLSLPQPSNPWSTDDITFWVLNENVVEVPTEKRVRLWAVGFTELLADPTGLTEFTNYLRKEYCHENIRFWQAVVDLRYGPSSEVPNKVKSIFDEFLRPGAPCEINIDGKTMEITQQQMKSPTRYTYELAVEHVYLLLLKKDCYPRFLRSEQYKSLLSNAIQPMQKKRFFSFGAPGRKKASASAAPNSVSLQAQTPQPLKRHGSDEQAIGSQSGTTGGAAAESDASFSNTPLQKRVDCDPPYRGDLPIVRPTSHFTDNAATFFSEKSKIDSTQDAEQTTGEKVDANICPWETMEPQPIIQTQTEPTVRNSEALQKQQIKSQKAQKTQDISKTIPANQSKSQHLATGSHSFSMKEQLPYTKVRPDRSKSMDVSTLSNPKQPTSSSQKCPTPTDAQVFLSPTVSKDPSEINRQSEKIVLANVDPSSVVTALTTITSVVAYTTAGGKKGTEGSCSLVDTKMPLSSPTCAEANVEFKNISEEADKKSGNQIQDQLALLAVSSPTSTIQSEPSVEKKEELTSRPSFSSTINPVSQKSFNIDYTVRSGHVPGQFATPTAIRSPQASVASPKLIFDALVFSTAAALTCTTSTTTTTMAMSTEQPSGSKQPSQPLVRPHVEEQCHARKNKDPGLLSETLPAISTKKAIHYYYADEDLYNPNAPTKFESGAPWDECSAPKSADICPWEDEESCKVDTPFVKTYATLGYL